MICIIIICVLLPVEWWSQPAGTRRLTTQTGHVASQDIAQEADKGCKVLTSYWDIIYVTAASQATYNIAQCLINIILDWYSFLRH